MTHVYSIFDVLFLVLLVNFAFVEMVDVKSDDGHRQRFGSNSAYHAHSKVYHLYDRFGVSNILVLGNLEV